MSKGVPMLSSRDAEAASAGLFEGAFSFRIYLLSIENAQREEF